jgi:hypothetical protein
MYCTSVNPSPGSNSAATYKGATQIAVEWPSRIFVVSGGGSAATGLGCKPRSPAALATVSPPRNARRLKPAVRGVLIAASSLLTEIIVKDAWARV